MNSLIPTQIGFVPSGVNVGSQFIVGKDIASSWEGAGLGPNGRPDIAQSITFFMTNVVAGVQTKVGSVSIDASGMAAVMTSNANAPKSFHFQMREFAVCESGAEKRVLVMASETYLPA